MSNFSSVTRDIQSPVAKLTQSLGLQWPPSPSPALHHRDMSLMVSRTHGGKEERITQKDTTSQLGSKSPLRKALLSCIYFWLHGVRAESHCGYLRKWYFFKGKLGEAAKWDCSIHHGMQCMTHCPTAVSRRFSGIFKLPESWRYIMSF